MSVLTYDYAIIGGGLAGLSLAIQLQKIDLKVVLFEKETYPFHRVCGEYVSMESYDFIESLGVPLANLNLPQITNLNVSAPNGKIIKHKLDLGGFGISRFTLDLKLYDAAIKVGVTVFTNCLVTDLEGTLIKTTKGDFFASKTIGSWGKRSKLDVKLKRSFLSPKNRNLNDYVGVKYHVQADLPANTIELHNFENGYCGISKIEENKYCLCYLVHGSELKKAGGSIKLMEENTLKKNPFLKEYFSNYPSLFEKPISISQISFEKKSQMEKDIPMVGDAAGSITPLCGNGMSMALHASKLLAKELEAHSKGQKSFEKAILDYQIEWKLQFSKRLKLGRIIQSLFGKSSITNFFIGSVKHFPSLINTIVKQTHGKPF